MELERDVILQQVKNLVLKGESFYEALEDFYDKYKNNDSILINIGKTDESILKEMEKLQSVMNKLEMQ
jgi:hypothetical protein